ncbi:hypothetical protein NDU88_005735 [Pleurodeles waltl]|uniref:Uncharacterized protein n=1 Tax=Pleurodeles waltl TaxID=8319 RepID=A0AAV7SMH9_PLEWA|nr:hypothetical protein NDU88_005735 [Pleurodeles waltl]
MSTRASGACGSAEGLPQPYDAGPGQCDADGPLGGAAGALLVAWSSAQTSDSAPVISRRRWYLEGANKVCKVDVGVEDAEMNV